MTGILDIDAADYHADKITDAPTLSASIAKILIAQSPAHAYAAHPRLNPAYQRDDDPKFDIGNVFHAVFLEGRDIVEPLAFPDWRTTIAKGMREEARAAGKIPLLVAQWQEVQAMLEAVRAQLPGLDVQPAMFEAGKPEQAVTWTDKGVQCRALVDWLRDDFTAIHDIKTTARSANPETWTRTMFQIGGDVQAVMNKRGVRAVTGVDPDFVFLVCETQPPYAVKPVRLASSALAVAEDKVDWALRTWAACLESGVWPAYDGSVYEAEVLPWDEARWIEKTWEEAA